MILPDLKTPLLWALGLGLVAALGVAGIERTRAGIATQQRDTARGERNALQAAINTQKAEAAALLASLNASVLAQQKRIDAAHAAQEKTDAQNLATVDRLRADLRRLRGQSAVAGRGGSGGRSAGQAGAAAEPGAGSGAPSAGLLPDPEAAADEDAYLADRVNEAYRSCRARLLGEAERLSAAAMQQ